MTKPGITKIISAISARIILYAFAAFVVLSASSASAFAQTANNPLRLKVKQIVTAPAHIEGATCSYTLNPRDPDSPMPEGSAEGVYVFTLTGNESFQIGPLEYTRQGIFTYDIKRIVARDKPGFVHDKRTYTIEVYVNSELDTGVVVLNESGMKEEGIEFESFYNDPSDPDKPVKPGGGQGGGQGGENNPAGHVLKTGDDTNLTLYKALLALSGIPAVILLIYLRKRTQRGRF